MSSILTPGQAALVEEVRSALAALRPLLRELEAPPEAERRLSDAQDGLSELFLLVFVGEFNAGKSALVNALLGGRYVEEGVTPTTRDIQVISAGPSDGDAILANGVRLRSVDSRALDGLRIVDTPGTNAILREHEALTRDYVPRADLVVFVTSADRPFTETERAFLESVLEWRKKVVFVVNKIDLLDPQGRREVIAYVTEGARRAMGTEPLVFALSARDALAAQEAGNQAVLEASGWPAFSSWLHDNLTAEERLRLKLESPLGVADKIVAELQTAADARLDVLRADGATLDELGRDVSAYHGRLSAEFARRLDGVELHLAHLRERGEAFLDERFRVSRIRGLLDRDALERDFEHEVIADAPLAIEREIGAIIDWMIDEEHTEWLSVLATMNAQGRTVETADGSSRFAARRRALLDSVGHDADALVAGFDIRGQSERVVNEVREALARTALVEVGALGLGLVLKAALTTAVADATGILAASMLAVVGLTIIPYKRSRAVAALRERTSRLRDELRTSLSEAFGTELDASVASMQQTIAPYLAFVTAEGNQLALSIAALGAARDRLAALHGRIPTSGSV
jgi:small GTP-binding protein